MLRFILLFILLLNVNGDESTDTICSPFPIFQLAGMYISHNYTHIVVRREATSSGEELLLDAIVTGIENGSPIVEKASVIEFKKAEDDDKVIMKGVVKDEIVGYKIHKETMLFAEYIFLREAPDAEYVAVSANISRRFDKQLFIFGGYVQVWLGCPQPVCFDGTVDAARMEVNSTFHAYRHEYYWKIRDSNDYNDAFLIVEDWPEAEKNIDAIFRTELGEFIYKGDLLYIYVADKDVFFEKISELLNASLSAEEIVTILSMDGFDFKWNGKMWCKVLDFTLIWEDIYINGAINNETHLMLFSGHKFVITNMEEFWAGIMHKHMTNLCKKQQLTELQCESLPSYVKKYPLKELNKYIKGLPGYDLNDAFFDRSAKFYYFIYKWNLVRVSVEKFQDQLSLDKPTQVEFVDNSIFVHGFLCPERLYDDFFNKSVSDYVEEMYKYLVYNDYTYNNATAEDITSWGAVSAASVAVALICIIAILAIGSATLYHFSPHREDPIDVDEKYELHQVVEVDDSPASSSTWSTPSGGSSNRAQQILSWIRRR